MREIPIGSEAATARLLRTIPLDALRGFEASARLLSFTAAAEELCVTQSAVSKQVKSLEDLLRRRLFVRTGRRLQLTPDGRRLHEGVVQMVRQLEAALHELTWSPRHSASITVTPRVASPKNVTPGLKVVS